MTHRMKPPAVLKRALGTWPCRLALALALCVLIPVGCTVIVGAVSDGCPEPNPLVLERHLPGTYTGPHGMKIRLAPGAPRDEGADTLRVEKWPFDLFAVDSTGKAGQDSAGKARLFDGSGDWSYAEAETSAGKYPRLTLHFNEGTPKEDVPSTDQHLMVGGTPDNPELYEDEVAGGCTNATYRRTGS
ncbi:hypothetical protein ACFQ2B_03685 [Streptomyces stramineus]